MASYKDKDKYVLPRREEIVIFENYVNEVLENRKELLTRLAENDTITPDNETLKKLAAENPPDKSWYEEAGYPL